VAALASALTLAAFVAALTRSLARGERFACACFGDDDEQISRRTLARSVALLAIAVALVSSATDVAGQPAGVVTAQLVGGLALGGIAVLMARVPALRRWNRDPFGMRAELWVDRGQHDRT